MKLQLKKLFATAGLLAAFASVSQAQWHLAGDFNGWDAGANPMTAGPNAGEYSYTITGQTPGAYGNAKVTDGTFNNAWPSQNLKYLYDSTGSATIHFWPGTPGDGWLPFSNRVGYDDTDNGKGWGIAGAYNGWDGTQTVLASLGNGVYSNNITVSSPASTDNQFKFQSPGGSWNDIYFGSDFGNNGNNGAFTTTTSPQTLPAVLDLPNGRWLIGTAVPTPPTNYITFQLDMSEQVQFGNFTNQFVDPSDPNNTNSVAIAGDFIGWGTGAQLTNNPSLPDLRSNIYSGTFPLQAFLPHTINVKFRVNNLDGGYEQPISTGGGDRSMSITNQTQVIPKLFYDDQGLGDLLVAPTTIQFSLYITNQTPIGTGGGFFTTGVDQLFVNGPWRGWDWGIGQGLPLTQVGSSDVYTNSVTLPRGGSLSVTYKYSAGGPDNENGSGTNHIRFIRSYAPNFVFPQDVWSSTLGNIPYPNPGISSTNIVEPSFGYLTIGSPVGGLYPITWLGRPGVFLQNNSSLSGGAWTTLSGTSGTQSTNMPSAGSVQFFRLLKP